MLNWIPDPMPSSVLRYVTHPVSRAFPFDHRQNGDGGSAVGDHHGEFPPFHPRTSRVMQRMTVNGGQ